MISVKNISVGHGGEPVLRGVSFQLRKGEIMGLLGPNGVGKSTLLRSLNGTLKPASGQIRIDGKAIGDLSRREIAKLVAVVAQENETKFPVTVLEYVLAGRFAAGSAFGWESAADVSASRRALAECELEEFAGRSMNELSGGERQRVVLARALAAETPVLLLDEPTANLDLAHQSLMFRLVRSRCREHGVTAVAITHDMNIAAEFADRVMLLGEGRVFASGSASDVLTQDNLSRVFKVNVLRDENPASGKVRVTTVY